MRILLLVLIISLLQCSGIECSSNLVSPQTQFLSVVATSSQNPASPANFTAAYNDLLVAALEKYNQANPSNQINAQLNIEEVKQNAGNPFITIVITFASISRDFTAEQMLALFGLMSTSEASLVMKYEVIVVLELVGASLVESSDTLDNKLWLLAPFMIGSFLVACIVACICFAIQPKTDDDLAKTTNSIFTQQRNSAWVHSRTKVNRLREPWSGSVDEDDDENEVNRRVTNSSDNTGFVSDVVDTGVTASHDATSHEEHNELTDPESPFNVKDGRNELKQSHSVYEHGVKQEGRPGEEKEAESVTSHLDEVASSSSNEAQLEIDLDLNSHKDRPNDDENMHNLFLHSAPTKVFSNEISTYDLWYYYRAFDQTSGLNDDKLRKDLTPRVLPSQLSHTLEYTHPLLVKNPTKAIVEQTGKYPPVFRVNQNKTTNLDDSCSDSSKIDEKHAEETLMSLGSTLYAKNNDHNFSTLKPVNTVRPNDKGNTVRDELDIAASTRFSKSVDENTFRHLQAELRRIYNTDAEDCENEKKKNEKEKPPEQAKDNCDNKKEFSLDSSNGSDSF